MIEEYLSSWLYSKIVDKYSHDSYTKTKIQYGLLVFFHNISKIFWIVTFSIIFSSFKEMMSCYVPFCLLRLSGFGYHARKSIICNLAGIFLFTLAPILFLPFLENTIINLEYLFPMVGILGLLIIYLFAPSFTEISRITDKKKIQLLKMINLSTYFVLMSTAYFMSSTVSYLMMYGMSVATLLLIPNNEQEER